MSYKGYSWAGAGTYIHTYIHTCIHAYMHTCIHTYIRTYIHTYMFSLTAPQVCSMHTHAICSVCMLGFRLSLQVLTSCSRFPSFGGSRQLGKLPYIFLLNLPVAAKLGRCRSCLLLAKLVGAPLNLLGHPVGAGVDVVRRDVRGRGDPFCLNRSIQEHLAGHTCELHNDKYTHTHTNTLYLQQDSSSAGSVSSSFFFAFFTGSRGWAAGFFCFFGCLWLSAGGWGFAFRAGFF